MSVEALGPEYEAQAIAMRLGEDDHGYGWVMFAATMLLLGGTINLIEGIAAIGGSHFFAGKASYITGDLNTWGWIIMIVGILEAAAGFGVLIKNQLARWAGVAVAALNATVQLLFMPAYPLWSLAVIAVDVLVMFGLIVYGGRRFRPV